ncbi:MAG: serine kinase [Deltaproteobacteria bacterium]|nr:serine kinase [Deltaproteobacteria bacterium]MBN2686858.1 serine kinase [Deltaproteobacteria bacterium]
MDLSSIAEKLNLRIVCGHQKLSVQVTGGYVGDLLSDVMANSREGYIWITRQTHQNIVAVASLKELAGIILVNGKDPEEDTLEKATAEGIPIFVTELSAFDIVGELYTIVS